MTKSYHEVENLWTKTKFGKLSKEKSRRLWKRLHLENERRRRVRVSIIFFKKKIGKKMRGKLMICTKCGGNLQNHAEGCDCKKAISKLSFSDDEI